MNEGISTDFTKNSDGSLCAFREVLENLNPTHIIATGYKLWEVLPPSDGFVEKREYAGKSLPICQYKTPDGFALVTAIHHTSRASASEWQAPVKAFLAG
jgi:hypothetical protein